MIIFFDTLQPNIKRLYENYVGEFPDRHIFAEALRECARRNCCLVINKRSRSADLYESVFLFQPQELWLSTKYFGDPQYEWVHKMFFSDQKFKASLGGGGGSRPNEGKGKGKKGAVKPPSKSFSIESIERKQPGRRGGKGGKGAGGSSRKKMGGQPQDYRPDASSTTWEDDDEDEFDPMAEQRKNEQQQVKQNLGMLRQNLKALGKQARTQNAHQNASQNTNSSLAPPEAAFPPAWPNAGASFAQWQQQQPQHQPGSPPASPQPWQTPPGGITFQP